MDPCGCCSIYSGYIYFTKYLFSILLFWQLSESFIMFNVNIWTHFLIYLCKIPPPPLVAETERPQSWRSKKFKTGLPSKSKNFSHKYFHLCRHFAHIMCYGECPATSSFAQVQYCSPMQWRNRRGAECPPETSWPGNFCWRIGKNSRRK